MKQWKRVLSAALVLVMVLTLLPAAVLQTAAAGLYKLLYEPSFGGYFQTGTYIYTAVVREDVYYSPTTGDVQLQGPTAGGYYYGPFRVVDYTFTGGETGVTFFRGGYYQHISGFNAQGYARAKRYDGSWTIIDSTGTEKVGSFNNITDLSDDGYFIGYDSNYYPTLYRLKDYSGYETFDIMDSPFWPNNAPPSYFSCGLALVRDPDTELCLYYTTDGVPAPGFENGFEAASDFSYGYAGVLRVGETVYEIIDTSGNTVKKLPAGVWPVGHMSADGIFTVKNGSGNVGYFSKNGTYVAQIQYEGGRDFRNGYAAVMNSNYDWGMIDTHGSIVIPFGLYDHLSDASSERMVWAYDDAGAYRYTPSVLRVGTAAPPAKPVITQHPANVTAEEGQTVSFTVAASGSGLSYQWYRKHGSNAWSAVTGATSPTYSVTAAASMDGNQYRCKVSNGGGGVYSNAATLTVTAPAITKPVITAQPTATTVTEGQTASFTVAATGGELQYQWYSRKGGAWSAVSGATSATLSFTAAGKDSGKEYRCKVFNSAGSTYSSAAALTVNAGKPVITRQPVSVTAPQGSSVTFSVTASGSGLSYQWYRKSPTGTWSAVTGATSSTLTITAGAGLDGYQYRCKVSNSAGGVYSSAATLTVTDAKPIVTKQPTALTVTEGQTATFTVTATGGNLHYQWYSRKGGAWSAVSGATSATLSFTAAAKDSGREYRCKVYNSAGSTYSAAAALTVNTGKPVIINQPRDNYALVGETVTFTVEATGSDLHYQWYRKHGTSAWAPLSGETSATLSFTATENRDGDLFRCKVFNSAGSVYSSAASLTVIYIPIVY